VGALWATSDVLRRRRLNRNAIAGRLLGLPMYDVDNSDVVQVAAKPIDGALLAAAVGTLYTAPASGIAQIHSIMLRNTHSASLAVELYLVPNAGSAGVPERIFDDTLDAGETVSISATGGWFLAASGTLRGKAGTTSLVAIRGEVTEWASQPDGLTLKVVDGVQLGTSYATVYTVPGSGVRYALLLNSTLCNTDTSDRSPQVTIVESGDTSSAEDEIFGASMFAKETFIDDDVHVLEPGDFIQARNAAAANVVSYRPTILEVAT
jgi:hypothetical protein